MFKNSVSPLIATVLLIAFTVAIGSVVMNWGTSYIKEEQAKATSTSDVRLKCATDVSLKLMKIKGFQNYCYTNNSENVTINIRLTKGIEILKGIRVNMISNSTSKTIDYNEYIDKINFNLKIIGFSKDLINENNLIEYVELVPYIDNNGENYFCSGSSLVINNLYLCDFEINDPYIPENLENSEIENPQEPEYENNYFVSVWNTNLTGIGSSASNQVKLPLESSGTYDFTIDWGDGIESYITTWNQVDVTHTYDQEGEYEIKINGTIIGFSFNLTGDRLKIKNIKKWGDLRLGNNGGYFFGTSNLNITATDVLNLTETTTLKKMFEMSGISSIPRINEWDVSNIIDMSFIFSHASNFNSSLSEWNVSSVTNMDYMFIYVPKFNFPLNEWDVSNVVSMNYLFMGASSFNQPLDGWNVSKVNSMFRMFQHALSFNQNISNWCVINVSERFQFVDDCPLQADFQPIWGTCPN